MVFSLLFYKNTAFLPTFCDFLPTFLQNSQFFSLRFATCHVDRMGDISLFAFCLGGHPGPHLVMLSEVETSLSSRASCVYSNAVRTFKLSCRPHGRHLLVCVLLGRTHRSASCHVERSRNIFVFPRIVRTQQRSLWPKLCIFRVIVGACRVCPLLWGGASPCCCHKTGIK